MRFVPINIGMLDDNAGAFEPWHGRNLAPRRIFSFDRVDVGRIDRRGAHIDHRFVRRRCRPGLGFDLQNLRRFSVRFVNNNLYSFSHR